jgi:ATP-dependent Lon protease
MEIIRNPYISAAQVAETTTEYPLLSLRTEVLFPAQALTVEIVQPDQIELVKRSLSGSREIVVALAERVSESEQGYSVHQTGCLARVLDGKVGAGVTFLVTLEGVQRVVLRKFSAIKPWPKVVASRLKPVSIETDKQVETARIMATLSELVQMDSSYVPEHLDQVRELKDDPSLFADRVAVIFRLSMAARMEVLSAVDLSLRLERLLHHLDAESQRMAQFRKLLGQLAPADGPVSERQPGVGSAAVSGLEVHSESPQQRQAARKRKLINSSPNLPPEVAARALIEVDRLEQLSTASAEYGVTKNYLDHLLALPWGRYTPENYEIADVERVLSTEYYGPHSVKEQILQRISVRKLMGGQNDGPTICLIGAPGTGKASLARAISRAMGKEFIRISVGGISDVADIKGSPRTFLGALPGKIIRTLQNARTADPVVLIEDVDYFNMDNDSSVNMALLDVMDVRRNAQFLDYYLGVPFDLSKVFFICSVRSFEDLPEPFVPRMEIMELPGYIEREKVVISKRYIIPSLLRRHGLKKSEVRIADKILSRIIRYYTQEAGLLQFSQQMEKIFRKIAFEKAVKKKTNWTIGERNLEAYLGATQYIPEKAETMPEIGTATGLAWTGAGGDLMFIEGLKMRGDGQIFTTGSLGDVMRESIQAAHSYVRSKADVLGVDFNDFNEFDIHVHFPSGAIPKDGPSAGVTVCLVIASVMSERPIRNDTAMTGEVTLRGRVLPVGGIKEKISAAYRSGIYHVVMPKENQKDLKELPKEIIRKTKFTLIERVDELFELCLLDFTPSSYTLEKIFAEEIEKAKKSTRKRKKTTKTTSTKAARPKKKE